LITDTFKHRSQIIRAFFILAACVLIFKAVQIQLVDTSYQERATATAIDKVVLYPSRGLIFDRNGKLLVNNNPTYDLKVTYNQIDPGMDTLKLCQLLSIDRATFEEKLNKNWRSARYSKAVPFTFESKIDAVTYAYLQEHLYEFPGFFVQLRNVRGYPHRHAAHVLGYLNEVSPAQIEASDGQYARGDYIGIKGLEKAYEQELKGLKGVKYILKDNLGREVGPYKGGNLDSAAVSGQDIITSLDLELQSYGELLMQNKTGSIVAIDPKNGEVLTMISAPTYDPNLLTINRNRGKAYKSLQQDSLRPFFDRSLMAKYPPGSIFKSVTGLSAMQMGVSTPNRGIACSGAYFFGGHSRGCHAHIHPSNIEKAMQVSCNSYFFQLVRDAIDKYSYYEPQKGLDSLVEYVYQFGLGKPLGIDLPGEVGGNVPTSEYYDYLYPKNKGSWKSPTVMSIGIGQGEIEMTTLQMANLAAVMANRGHYYTPHLIKGFRDNDTPVPTRFRERQDINIDRDYFTHIVDGMELVTIAGTGRSAAIPGIPVCGKTGTSQNPHGADHSVFFAFAPKDDPQIALAVYVEHGIWGATYAAPIAGLMIEKYLRGSIDPSKKYLEERMLNAKVIEP